MLYDYTIFPLECVYKIVYLGWYELFQSYGVALIALSFTAHIVLAPLIEWGKRFQAEENRLQEILQPQIAAIKENFHGAAAHKELAWLYKRYGYHPAMAVRSAMMVLVQLPFLMAAYYMLSALPDIEGISFGAIVDLSEPDGLLGGVNLLPIAMTLLNFGATFGQQNFSRRDRVQAVVIALLFLVLLYDAPSALLVYWTGNNFWMFAESVGQKSRLFVKITAIFGAGQAKLWSIVKKNCVPLALSLTLCLFVPLDFYLSNADEIWFTAPEILPYLLTATLVLWLLLSLPIKFLPPRGKIFYGAALLGLTIGVFGQSYLLNPDYGALTGADIRWEEYRHLGYVNGFIWLMIFVLTFRYIRRYMAYQHRLKAIFAFGSAIILMFQIIPLCYVGATTPIDKHQQNILTTYKMLDVSAKDNIIVIVLDMFDTRFFQTMRQEDPELIEELDGFTYYPDAVSLFGNTDYSMPQMLTGAVYDNAELYSDYIRRAWQETDFYNELLDNNYDIGIYANGAYVSDAEPVDNLIARKDSLNNNMRVNRYTVSAYARLCLFRSLPHFLKKYFVVYSGELMQQDDNATTVYTEDNLKFYRELSCGLRLHTDKNSFRWYHLDGAHMPYDLTRDIEPIADKRGTVQDKAVGSFKIALNYLRQMKHWGIYDRATIMIVADHGVHDDGGEFPFESIKPVPLVLVKQPGERGFLKTSPNCISFKQLPATLAYRFPHAADKYGADFARDNEPARYFRYMTFTVEHPITEYVIEPKAWENDSWHIGRSIRYAPTVSNEYRIGTNINFSREANYEKYIGSGWLRSFGDYTATKGKESYIHLRLSGIKQGETVVMRMKAGVPTHPNGDIHRQNVDVYVNDAYLCTWHMEDNHWQDFTVSIPYAYLNGNKCLLKFVSDNTYTRDRNDELQEIGFYVKSIILKHQ